MCEDCPRIGRFPLLTVLHCHLPLTVSIVLWTQSTFYIQTIFPCSYVEISLEIVSVHSDKFEYFVICAYVRKKAGGLSPSLSFIPQID
ncbi:hypothetical protein XELAEV_18043323mg [Xenopus laevis]|uniref:Uncharacterized protein n=1 Tax=Xenopus laevis TaxID=8355 RepID=A0A974H291_XENLA|nr:hypothetical protein XELAEV_18043323mg [Xenopus laevis]